MAEDSKRTDNFTLEEAISSCERMIYSFVKNAKAALMKYQNNVLDEEDLFQIGTLVAMETYKVFDESKGSKFSTLLYKNLNHKTVMLIRQSEAKIRKAEQKNVYLDKTKEENENLTYSNVIGKDDEYFKDEESQLETFLKENLSADEMLLFSLYIKRQIYKKDTKNKSSLKYLLQFVNSCHDYGDNINRGDACGILNITYPTLNKRIEKAAEKVKSLANRYVTIAFE